MDFSTRLRELRKEHNMNQEDLAIKINSTKSSISRYENGINEPSQQDLITLSKLFSVSTDYLLGLSDIRDPYEIETIAAHKDDGEWTDEELDAIEQFKAFVRSQNRLKKE